MASAIQQPSVIRKLVYASLILALFAAVTFAGPFTRALTGADPTWTLAAQQKDLELSELDRGSKAELSASAVRLSLTGSRGLAITTLWGIAIELQKRHEWNELEMIVKTITKLQPHFLTPWLFQSWNLSYNVSVESDRVKDKYFYITRGIELLAEGERKNKRNPDMRYWIGFTTQNKFGVSDEVNYLTSLFQMSCIDPKDRDPKRFREEDGTVNLAEFQAFCEKNPHLVRRLRDKLKMRRPEQIVEFLAENRQIPTRFDETPRTTGEVTATTPLKAPEDQFPTLPLQKIADAEYAEWLSLYERTADPEKEEKLLPFNGQNQNEATADESKTPIDDSFDPYLAAKSWFTYSQAPVIPPSKDPAPTPKEYNRLLYRIPRQPALIIFRQAPPLAQSKLGERYLKEGWFDDSGWVLEDRNSNPDTGWFDQTVILGKGRNWSAEAWGKAFTMWRDHGAANGLYLSPERLQDYQKQAQVFRVQFGIEPEAPAPELRPDQLETEALRQGYAAHNILRYYGQNRMMTNFPHHYFRSQAEKEPETIQARKAFFEADSSLGDQEAAIAAYQRGFMLWGEQLLKWPEFRADGGAQDDIYEKMLRYAELMQEYRGQRLEDALVPMLAAGAILPQLPLVPSLALVQTAFPNPSLLPLPVIVPLEGNAPDGRPWIPDEAKQQVISRLKPDKPAPKTAGGS